MANKKHTKNALNGSKCRVVAPSTNKPQKTSPPSAQAHFGPIGKMPTPAKNLIFLYLGVNLMDQFITREAFSLMTEAQRIAFASLLSRDLDVITPFYITGNKSDNYLFGQVRFNQTGLTIWFGIEPDGYTHT